MIQALKRRLALRRDRQIIQHAQIFRADWYANEYPDVSESTALDHYLNHGAREGRNPNADFDTAWYVQTYPDVQASSMNPLAHYVAYGRKENRRPHAGFDGEYACLVCGQVVDDFLELPAHFTENLVKYGFPYAQFAETTNLLKYLCAHCHASDRERLYALYIERALRRYQPQQSLRMLDIGPAPRLGKFIDAYAQIQRVTSDLYAEGVDYRLDITDMHAFDDNSFDLLLCSHVLEHIPDDRKALRELYRVLKRGGWGIVMVPICMAIDAIDEDPTVTDEGERWRRFGQDDHIRLYNHDGFVQRVESAGFVVRQLDINYFGKRAFLRYGFSPSSVLYIVEKH
jgi:SAM-dependent methyltransferase